jgi:hypothetical protein
MNAEITFVTVEPLNEKPEILHAGSFEAVSQDSREFCFDFFASETHMHIRKDGRVNITVFLKQRDIECFISDNKENGVDDEEITPEFITSSTIEAINYECYMNAADEREGEYVELELVSFGVEADGVEKYFPEEEIARINADVMPEGTEGGTTFQ